MSKLNTPNRRTFVAANLGVAALGVSGVSAALPTHLNSAKADWPTLCATEMETLKGQKFTVRTDGGEMMKLRLTEVIAAKSGPARPKTLRRQEGLIAVFEAAKSCCNYFAENGHQNVDMRHPALGASRVFLGAVPSRKGGHKIEMVLN